MTNYDDGDPAVFQILLVLKILVGCQECVITGLFSGGEQFAISQAIPSQINRNVNNVASEVTADGKRYALIEQNAHIYGA
jgi:hypothetical protein